MYWGTEHTAIYNEAYLDLAGNKHPKLMGQSYMEAWAEIWDEIKPVFDAAWNHGQATMKNDDQLFLNRNGFLEETFFNWSIVPLLGGDGSVVALYNPAFENTRRKVNERRMLTLREIGEKTSHARNVGQFWRQVHESMQYNEWDIPFALIYSVTEDSESENLIEGIQWRGFGDPSRNIVVFPVHPTTGESVVGFVVIATSMASVVLFEEEIKRGQQAARLAALDRQQLSLQLRLRTQEAVESEYKFTRMAEFAPVGIFIANAEGNINFCNDSWWEISRHPRTINSINTWMKSVLPVDRPAVEAAWRKLIEEKVSIVQELRFKARREFNGHPIETWALMSAYPEKDSEGDVKAIFGVITDISQQKWAEAFQNQRREEAVELKRQQENFIDMTSHEMRNPLSALCQCADEIIGSIAAYRKSEPDIAERLSKMLDTCLEAANTISLCSNHQKRIVDDVLTLSRLDSRMVEVTPTVVSPVEVIQTSLKMFDTELASNNIKAEFRIDQSYRNMGIELARLDPARLQQIIINLLTNAIKFIQKQEERSIVITLAASKEACQAQICGIEFTNDGPDAEQDITDKPDWGTGEKFNLHICVADTGPGLTDEERSMLFQRFRQASPRTHVEYGGSGLGLFISRMLTELQGGQIGVISEKGVGSTFAFYIKSRKSVEPQLPSPSLHKDGADLLTLQPTIDPRTIDVLVVEDNQVNQKVLGRLLRNSGFNAHLANHGGEAIQKLQRSRHWNHEAGLAEGYGPVDLSEDEDIIDVSIILMDLEMPVMDGTTCARTIRELEKQGVLTARIPIIAVTAYVRPEQIGEARASGMDDVVSKPFRARELTPKITELLLNPPTGQIPYSPLSMASPAANSEV
ncbi:putative histidine kinase group protein [Diaporthe ampelina]|uniref:Putative histidine kinase group protein n=1 Tax=Diaporthe ampelina TaxID=1214573 RepID=A0A0G2HAF2_9PEZI|nr:putative histidine kinase group protein [Diaporthe ampelina]